MLRQRQELGCMHERLPARRSCRRSGQKTVGMQQPRSSNTAEMGYTNALLLFCDTTHVVRGCNPQGTSQHRWGHWNFRMRPVRCVCSSRTRLDRRWARRSCLDTALPRCPSDSQHRQHSRKHSSLSQCVVCSEASWPVVVHGVDGQG